MKDADRNGDAALMFLAQMQGPASLPESRLLDLAPARGASFIREHLNLALRADPSASIDRRATLRLSVPGLASAYRPAFERGDGASTQLRAPFGHAAGSALRPRIC